MEAYYKDVVQGSDDVELCYIWGQNLRKINHMKQQLKPRGSFVRISAKEYEKIYNLKTRTDS